MTCLATDWWNFPYPACVVFLWIRDDTNNNIMAYKYSVNPGGTGRRRGDHEDPLRRGDRGCRRRGPHAGKVVGRTPVLESADRYCWLLGVLLCPPSRGASVGHLRRFGRNNRFSRDITFQLHERVNATLRCQHRRVTRRRVGAGLE